MNDEDFDDHDEDTCGRCGGSGEYEENDEMTGYEWMLVVCWACKGKGVYP